MTVNEISNSNSKDFHCKTSMQIHWQSSKKFKFPELPAGCYWYLLSLPPANEVWGKVVFSVVCVKNSVHRGVGGIPACIAGGIPARHAGLGGVGGGGWVGIPVFLVGLQPHTQGGSWGVWPGGSPGPHMGEGGLQAHTWGVSQHALRQTPPKQTATAAVGKHPTGMHSCFLVKLGFCKILPLIW